MKILVLMSTFNGEKYLEAQLDSIKDQIIDSKVEILVRDDGSTDGTINILKNYEKKMNMSWYQGENLGAAHSFMDLIEKCGEYDYYAFCDQDDYWLPGKLQRAQSHIACIGEPVLYCSNAKVVDSSLHQVGLNVYRGVPILEVKSLTVIGGLLGCTMFMNKEMIHLIKKHQNQKKVIMHDFYIAQLCALVGGKIIYDSEPTLLYRQHGNNEVGVSYNLLAKIKDRVCTITKQVKVSIADQSGELADLYGDYICMENLVWLKKVSNYRENFLSRCKLAFSKDIHCANLNQAITLRLAVLLGNR